MFLVTSYVKYNVYKEHNNLFNKIRFEVADMSMQKHVKKVF